MSSQMRDINADTTTAAIAGSADAAAAAAASAAAAAIPSFKHAGDSGGDAGEDSRDYSKIRRERCRLIRRRVLGGVSGIHVRRKLNEAPMYIEPLNGY